MSSSRYPSIIATAVFLAGTMLLVDQCLNATGGLYSYALDDAYIHLELAWQLVTNGTWGINPGEPASASSSPLWTLLLAAALSVVGHRTEVAALVAIAAGALALWTADALLRSMRVQPPKALAALLLMVLLVPLPVMAALGMEHTLQLALTLAVVGQAIPRDPSDQPTAPSGLALACLALLCATRFEGVFLAASWAGLLAHRRRWAASALIATTAALPIAIFALFSLWIGNAAIPNGITMKSVPLSDGLGANLMHNAKAGAAMYLPAVVLWLSESIRLRTPRASPHAWLLVGTVALHLSLASIGWYYRYEAWLVGWGVLAAAGSASRLVEEVAPTQRRLSTTVLALVSILAALACGQRAWQAGSYLPSRTQYTADAKVRLARALESVAPGTVIALHDIGAMSWETDLHIVDTAALGSNEVLRLHTTRTFTGATIAEVARREGADIGLATESWMSHDPPSGWTPVARLTWALDPVRTSEPIVAYAIGPNESATAVAWLRAAVSQMQGRGRLDVRSGTTWEPEPPPVPQ